MREPGSAMPFQRSAGGTAMVPAGRPVAPGSRTTLSPSASGAVPAGVGGGSRRENGSKGGCSLPVFWPSTERRRQITKTARARKIRVVMSKEFCIVDPV